MGITRERPARLAGKLLQIRVKLGLTLEEMRQRLEYGKSSHASAHLTRFENGTRVPSLPVLLRYARAAGVAMEMLVDDELELPDKIPTTRKRMGL